MAAMQQAGMLEGKQQAMGQAHEHVRESNVGDAVQDGTGYVG